jgi:hypothetical protein
MDGARARQIMKLFSPSFAPVLLSLVIAMGACGEDDPNTTDCPAKPPLFGTSCLGQGTCTYSPCASDGRPSVSAVCVDGTFSLSTHVCSSGDASVPLPDADMSEVDTGPPLSGGIGVPCTVDETCDPTDLCGSLLGYPGDDPAKSCSSDSRTCTPDSDGILRCDGAHSICINSICMSSCTVAAGTISGCPGRTACNLVAFGSDLVGHGYCAFGCTRDSDCLDPDMPHCATEIGRCRPTTDPLTKHPGDACTGNLQCLCVDGRCRQFCRTGESTCTCVPFGPKPPDGVVLPPGLGGTCE